MVSINSTWDGTLVINITLWIRFEFYVIFNTDKSPLGFLVYNKTIVTSEQGKFIHFLVSAELAINILMNFM